MVPSDEHQVVDLQLVSRPSEAHPRWPTWARSCPGWRLEEPRARPYRPVTLLSQNNGADAKPVVDLNSRCDAIHLTFKIPIHQHQVGLMLGGCEDGLLPRSQSGRLRAFRSPHLNNNRGRALPP